MTLAADAPVSAQTAYWRRLTAEQKAAMVERNRARKAQRSNDKAEADRNRAAETYRTWSLTPEAKASKTVRDRRYMRDAKGTELGRRRFMLKAARDRAQKNGLEFNITLDDVLIPATCPIDKGPIDMTLSNTKYGRNPRGPTIDRIDNEKGYVKGNIEVVSHQSNVLKSNGSLEDFRNIIKYLEERL